MKIKKENKFFALIISRKHFDNFVELKPEVGTLLANISTAYAQYRKAIGKKIYNKYIICNQDEPYAEKVWQIILDGEKEKFQKPTKN